MTLALLASAHTALEEVEPVLAFWHTAPRPAPDCTTCTTYMLYVWLRLAQTPLHTHRHTEQSNSNPTHQHQQTWRQHSCQAAAHRHMLGLSSGVRGSSPKMGVRALHTTSNAPTPRHTQRTSKRGCCLAQRLNGNESEWAGLRRGWGAHPAHYTLKGGHSSSRLARKHCRPCREQRLSKHHTLLRATPLASPQVILVGDLITAAVAECILQAASQSPSPCHKPFTRTPLLRHQPLSHHPREAAAQP